jgi:hypothetical protein
VLVEPTAIDPKPSDAGSRVAVASDVPVPVPVRLTVCDPELVLSFTVSVAERDPDAVGEKVTVTRQVASGLIVPELGQVLAGVMAKSPGFAPVRVMLLMARVTVVLVSVRVELCAALVEPTAIDPKPSDEGRSVAVARLPVAPTPLRAMVCFPLLVLSLTVNVADRDPVAVGVNVIETRHVPRGLTVPELEQVVAGAS